MTLVYDGQQISIYKNNKLLYSNEFNSNLESNDFNLEIGRDVPGSIEYFTGAIDELKIFNKALTEQEIEELYKGKEYENTTSFCINQYAYNNIIFLLDVSESMKDNINFLKTTFISFLGNLRPEDSVAVVSFSSNPRLNLKFTSCSKKDTIEKILKNIGYGGKTNLEPGIILSYETMRKSFNPKYNNRIILASDGGFKISNKIKNTIKKNSDIYFSIFHFTKDTLVNQNLKELTEFGSGNYSIISKNNIQEVLWKELTSLKNH
jgi:Mg-chelatase subunit ChlD